MADADRPEDVALQAEAEAAAGALTADGAKELLRALDRMTRQAEPGDCRAAAQRVVDAARSAGVGGRGILVLQANLLARLGDAEGAADLVVTAHAEHPDGFKDTHPVLAWKLLRRHGSRAAAAYVDRLQAAGVPMAHQLDPSALLESLQEARTATDLDAAVDGLERAGGFPDVVAAGRALGILRTAHGRRPEHVLRLVDLAIASSAVTPRVVNDALIVLSELGAADESRTVLARAEAAGVPLVADHRLLFVTALANAMRFDDALAAYQAYLDDGFPANARARRVHVAALALTDRTAELSAALLDWARAVRAGEVTDPPANVLATALTALARDDITLLLEVFRGGAGAFTFNGTHRRILAGHAQRTLSVPTYAEALAAAADAGVPPTAHELDALVEMAVGGDPEEVVEALRQVVRAAGDALPRLALPLVRAHIATGDLVAAEATAGECPAPAIVEALVAAHLDAGDLDGALRGCELFEHGAGTEPAETAHPRMPYPPALVTRVVRGLAVRRGTDAAERWLRRHSPATWPVEAWEALARAHRRDKGNSRAIEQLMGEMREAGGGCSGGVWAEWLYAVPRHKRAARLVYARAAMRADKVVPTPSFHTAAIVGALQPDKVPADRVGTDAEAAAWENAQRAVGAGERLLVKAVESLTPRAGARAAQDGWFTAAQLLEIARAYPLARRPYAQLDSVVEVRVAAETEPDEQFAAFLGAVAAAHARALLPEGVKRLRTAAVKRGLGRPPELTAALFDALAGRPESVPEVAAAEAARGALAAPVVAEAAGRALAATGSVEAVLGVLDGTDDAALDEEPAEALLSAATLALAEAGQSESAQELGRAAESRGLSLSPAAQASLLTTQRPEAPAAAEQGPVWTTAQLAAYNSLLEHELANHLRGSRASTELLRAVTRNLRRRLPDEVATDFERDLAALDDVVASLRRSQNLQQRSIAKIAAAADLERRSAGAVPVLATVESVVEQLESEAVAAHTEVRLLDREGCGGMAVRGHATLLQFALHNLVSNAIKAHTRRKGDERRVVEILATFGESTREDLAVAPYGWVVLSVRDHGDGVPEDLPDNVANWSIPGQPGQGAGIGLRVTENMVRQSGGQLWIDTSVAEGSRFCFRLPSAARRNARAAHRGARVEEM
ncbi:ATP-binding protein [Geodermatophilus sp. SYSU D00698]